MNERIQSCLKGVYVALLAVLIYAVALGCFISLMLLVISMEEGGSLSSMSIALTSAVVVLSQGIGFSSGSFLISLIPLSLSVMLVLLIRALAVRIGTSWPGFFAGTCVWLGIFAVVLHASSYSLLLPLGIRLLCVSGVFAFAYLWALLPRDEFTRLQFHQLQAELPKELGHSIWLAVRVWISLMVALLICGIATVIVWISLNASTMGTMFQLNSMGTGSRIVTTLASLAWLPNLCLWAISWLSGSGFSIGSSSHFSLWIGQSTELPPVPAFGLLPSALEGDTLRLLCMSVPVVIAFMLGMLVLLHSKAFDVWRNAKKHESSLLSVHNLRVFGYPLLSFCLVSILIALSSSVIFSLSNGALGSHNLAHVGVDVRQTSSTLVHAITLGLALSWGVMVLLYCVRFGFRWLLREISNRADVSDSLTTSDEDSSGNDSLPESGDKPTPVDDNDVMKHQTSETKAMARRVSARVVSGTSEPHNGTEAFNPSNDSQPHPKEDQ
ncbi:MAG: DUF6350 domain-containing protein [Bifidobacterium crudilactis]|jgi:hypothetical protein|uniref:cell division protein PerM n=1 Tax=Bifidobacterium crudilactis TaxID=327277 RepID=UPI003A5C0E86